MIEKANRIYEELLRNSKEFDHHLVMKWKDRMPKEFARAMMEEKYGKHIYDEDLYHEATNHFVNPDGSKGPHWSIDTIKSKSGIDFDNKEYTCYDYAYVVNMLYSDYAHVFTEPSYYLKMAKAYLEDEDYFGNPSERAYCNAMKRIDYFSH